MPLGKAAEQAVRRLLPLPCTSPPSRSLAATGPTGPSQATAQVTGLRRLDARPPRVFNAMPEQKQPLVGLFEFEGVSGTYRQKIGGGACILSLDCVHHTPRIDTALVFR